MTEELLAPTRVRLLLAAQELIEEGGYGAASVAAIAERAGVAAGTLYRHFSSKEELFVELFREVCDREVRAMREAAVQMADDARASSSSRQSSPCSPSARSAAPAWPGPSSPSRSIPGSTPSGSPIASATPR